MKPLLITILAILSTNAFASETKFTSGRECGAVFEEIGKNYKRDRDSISTYRGNGKVIRIACGEHGGFLIVNTEQEEAVLQAKIQKDMLENRLKEQHNAKTFLKSVNL